MTRWFSQVGANYVSRSLYQCSSKLCTSYNSFGEQFNKLCYFIFLASANFQCSFKSCPRRNVQLTEGDPPLSLPCNINTSSATTGNYTYCNNATILVPHTNSSYTIENIDYTLDKSTICCFDNEAESCAVCYDFSVYCKYPVHLPVCCNRVIAVCR